MEYDVQKLLTQLRQLQAENAHLKHLLDEVGISYIAPPKTHSTEITKQLARRFYSYFWGRTDVYSKRSVNKSTGKTGYYPQCENLWKAGLCPKKDGKKVKCSDCRNRKWRSLEAEQIMAHLRGEKEDGSDVIGVYPLFPDGTCRFLVFDFDNHEKGGEILDFANMDDRWIEEVNALWQVCEQNEIPCLVERSRSGRGAHLWIFFETAMEAALVRRFGNALLDKGAETVNLKSFRFYDRMLPAQTSVGEGELGYLIALPLQGHALKNSNSIFVNQNWEPFPDQWAVLFSTKKLSQKAVENCFREWNLPDENPDVFLPEETKPWERKKEFHREDVAGSLRLTLANRLYIETANLKPRLQNQLRRMAAIQNPLFYRNQAMGLSNYANSRYLYLGEDDSGFLCIPRGLLDRVLERCKEESIPVKIEDLRVNGRPLDVKFTGELRDNQQMAVNAMRPHDCGILSAATAFGKTVVCSNMIAERKISTLILLESSALIEQWQDALERFLKFGEEPPEYETKSGKKRRRKSVVGIIHGPKDTSTGIVDIAMAGSLCKKGEFHPRLREYGMVLVDECHHSASDTLRSVLQEVHARYVYGVTATPFRGDGLEKINEMLLGPVRFQYSAKEKAAEQGIGHYVVPRFTRTVLPFCQEKIHVTQAYERLRENESRNELIAADVKRTLENGRTPVILTRFTNQAAALYGLLRPFSQNSFLLTGEMPKKERDATVRAMANVPPEESLALVATGQLVGEGFDFPRLDTLFLATPVSWKGVVEQYAGRLHRDYLGKKDVIIYDYVDSHIPVFDNMYAKRLRTYKRIGYTLHTMDAPDKQNANAIYDSDSYRPIFEQDLREATKSVVISSPTLSRKRVEQLLALVEPGQENGLKVAVITWHPDVYRYGKDEHRLGLLEFLRTGGCEVHLAQDNCQHYAVIDENIVWYGSMNLLSRDDVEDNIMRLESREIAEELLGIL